MSRYISQALRQLVEKRANRICEYCLAFEGYSYVRFQIDHIISLKHGGLTNPDNLALSSFTCNNNKGTDVGTILMTNIFIRLYNPRKDRWKDHFKRSENYIFPKTEIGEATIKVLDFNHEERLEERMALIEVGRFPHPNALKLIE